MLDLNRLRLLRELELRGTIASVAASLHYSPSNVSQQLSQLEREVGVALLEPEGRRVRLTANGLAIARYAEQVMQLEERTRAQLDTTGEAPETVRVATIASASRGLVPRALDIIKTTATYLRVEISVVTPEFALAELETRHYDLVLAEEYPGEMRERRNGIKYHHLTYDPIRVVVPKDSLASSLIDLREALWVLEPPGSAVRHWAVQQCRSAGFEPDIRFVATDLDAHIALIVSGHGVGILPDLIWAGQTAPVRLIDLPTPLQRELFVAVRASAVQGSAIQTVLAALARAVETDRS